MQLNYNSANTYAGDYGWKTGVAYNWVDWRWDESRDHAVCYPAGRDMAMTVRLHVSGSAGSTGRLRVTGPDGINGEADFMVSCGTHTVDVNIETTHVPSSIEAYEPMTLFWYARESPGDEWAVVGTTQHNVYVTYDWPAGSEPTPKRLSWVCKQAIGKSIAYVGEIVDRIHQALNTDPPNDGQDAVQVVNDWRLLIPDEVPDPWHAGQTIFRYAGECHQQAQFMNLALKMLGITSGWDYKTCASTDANVVNDWETKTAAQLGYNVNVDVDGNGVAGDEVFELIFHFPDSEHPGWHWNNFEGSLQTQVGYYAVWPSLRADSAFDLYCQITNQVPRPNQLSAPKATQYWVVLGTQGQIVYFHPTPVPRASGCP